MMLYLIIIEKGLLSYGAFAFVPDLPN